MSKSKCQVVGCSRVARWAIKVTLNWAPYEKAVCEVLACRACSAAHEKWIGCKIPVEPPNPARLGERR